MSDRDAVLFSNDAFYAAFARRDMAAMTDVWAEDDNISVIHPGWEPIFGQEAVLESWQAIIGGDASPEISCRSPRAAVRGTVGIVVCFEEIQGSFLIATNVFVKDDGRWRMTHHQAAPTRGRPSEDEPKESIN
jgi:ketosteroid isomerase-like protein